MSLSRIRTGCLLFLALAASSCGAASESPADSAPDSETATLTQFSLPPENTATPSEYLESPAIPDSNPSPSIESATASTFTPTNTITFIAPGPAYTAGPLCDDAVYVSDVTIPDGTVIQPGAAFKKTWSVRNKGTCGWTTAYTIAQAGGEAMGGVATHIPQAVGSGDIGEVSVDLVAPMVPGTHIGHWQLMNAEGFYFGAALFVQIVVPDTSGSWTATPLPPSPTPPCDASVYVSDVTIPDGTEVESGASFRKTWGVRNTGSCRWTTAYTIAYAGGEQMDGTTAHIPEAVNPGDATQISVDLVAPSIPGNYTGHWQMKNPGGFYFGVVLFVQIIVR
jgi:hypothetical protein